jgi:polyisoprenoid-binding protein YceI
MTHRLPALLAIALAASIPATAAAPGPSAQGWTVDQAGSSLGYAGSSDEGTFEGTFGGWQAEIAFDPANLGASHVAVTIDMSSADSGDPNRDTPLLEGSWFAVAMFPTATFETDTITANGSGGYVADGTLTIRGHAEKVSLPFTLAIAGDTATMQGSVTIDRSKWQIGKGTWQDKSVANEVQVKVSVKATKAG